MSKYPYINYCHQCKSEFQIKSAQEKSKKFCSTECNYLAKRIHAREINCIACNKLLATGQRKFCSKSCSATYYNDIRHIQPKQPKPYTVCLNCGISTQHFTKKYCSRKCSGFVRRNLDPLYHKKVNAARQSLYRAKNLRKIHPTANKEKIRKFYLSCPIGYEVDHITPLSLGGLHHEDNLQYLTILENRKKGNRWIG